MVQLAPVQSVLFTVVPLALAFVQLANSVVNELPFFASVPFAVIIVGFAVLLNQYNFVRVRRNRLERIGR
jgi:hypothetical protein